VNSAIMADTTNAVNKPKRPLSAYNIFFKTERAAILQELPDVTGAMKPRRSHGKIGFKELAMRISAKWKSLPPEIRLYFDELAAIDKQRYLLEKKEWQGLSQGQMETVSSLQPPPEPLDRMAAHQSDLALSCRGLGSTILRRFSLFGGPKDCLANSSDQVQQGPDELDSYFDAKVAAWYSSVDQNTSSWTTAAPAEVYPASYPEGNLQAYEPNPTSLANLTGESISDLRHLTAELDEECKALLRSLLRS
jgi:HMG-box domain